MNTQKEGAYLVAIIKKLAIMIWAILLFSLLPISTNASAADDRLRYGKEMLRQMGNANALVYVYDVLATECNDAKSSNISIKNSQHKINADELNIVYQIFRNDYPEYFWLPTEYQYQLDSEDAYVEKIMFNYIIRKSISEDKKAVESKANFYIQKAQGKLDFDKSHILHDLLIENITYSTTTNARNQDIYSAFVEGKAVCAGYAKAYEYLLHKVGIPAFSVTGQSAAPGSDKLEPHEWTMALLDGHWYCTDVTWDDQNKELFHAYLNVTVEQLIDDHPVIRFEKYLPKTDSKEDNFFTKNKHKFSTLDINLVINDLKTQSGHSEIYYDGKLANMPTILNSLATELSTKLASVNRNYCTCDFTILGKEIHIQAKQHTVSGSKCSVCGATISAVNAGSSGSGQSSSQANAGSASGKPNSNGSNSADNTNSNTNTHQQGNSSGNATDTDNGNATAPDNDGDGGADAQSSPSTDAEAGSDTVTDPSADGQTETDGNKPNDTLVIIAIIGGMVVTVGIAVGIVFFIKKKKMHV